MPKTLILSILLLAIMISSCRKSDSTPEHPNKWTVDGKSYSSASAVFNFSNSLAASSGSGNSSEIFAIEFFWSHTPDKPATYRIVDNPNEAGEAGIFVLHEEKTYKSLDSSVHTIALEMVNGKMSVTVPPMYVHRTYSTMDDSVLVEGKLLQTR